MPQAAFLDCEFTDLQRPQLLSVGLVTLTGASFYAEYNLDAGHGLAMSEAATTFVHDTVFLQFGLMPSSIVETEQEMGDRLAQWLVEQQTSLEVAYDYGWDFELLERVLKTAGRWEQVGKLLVPTHVGYLWGAQAALDAAELSWEQSERSQGFGRHHSLADAQALKDAYLAVHG